MSTLNTKWSEPDRIEARHYLISGRVQGIGFRPFVYRLATELGLAGHVGNTNSGAEFLVEGPVAYLDTFAQRLVDDLPESGQIDRVDFENKSLCGLTQFVIAPSRKTGQRQIRIPPDRKACQECLAEIADPLDRRVGFAMTACTHCGPRFSVVESLPYDRHSTSLKSFRLCDECQREYSAPTDRRFHAQAINCPKCGPRIRLVSPSGTTNDSAQALRMARQSLAQGECLAVKGLGGFQLLVRADDDRAVMKLRLRKHRGSKPLAVMVADHLQASVIALFSETEWRLLSSPENPIVLLRRRLDAPIAESVAPGLMMIGLFLPTTPLHALLIKDLGFPVVATSGNRCDEPPSLSIDAAFARLGSVADAFLDHERLIVRRLDDSVARVMVDRPVVFRLGRGYAPRPLPHLEPNCFVSILAMGGHLKAAMAAHTGEQAFLWPHLGDLNDPLSRAGFVEAIEDMQDLYQFRPEHLVVDLHPDYYSTRWAEKSGLPLIRVQHHHAHAAAVQAEHGLLNQRTLAITWDGTGYGNDGTMWGGETMVTEPQGRYRRVASLRPLPLLGGEAAIRQPSRIAFALLWETMGSELLLAEELLRRIQVTTDEARQYATMLRRSINVVWTTAVGRLIDGLASLVLGIGKIGYEAEAAIRLEDCADRSDREPFRLPNYVSHDLICGDWRPMIKQILSDVRQHISAPLISWSIHQTLGNWACRLAAIDPDGPVVLGGGCFQNRILVEYIRERLGDRCYHAERIPPGDGGLAAGQLAVAIQQLTWGSNDVSRNTRPTR